MRLDPFFLKKVTLALCLGATVVACKNNGDSPKRKPVVSPPPVAPSPTPPERPGLNLQGPAAGVDGTCVRRGQSLKEMRGDEAVMRTFYLLFTEAPDSEVVRRVDEAVAAGKWYCDEN